MRPPDKAAPLGGIRGVAAALLGAAAVMLPALSHAQRSANHEGLNDYEKTELADHENDWKDANWRWSELFYGASYMTAVEVRNFCGTYEFVELYASDGIAPFLDAPERFLVHPNSFTRVNMMIVTPPGPTAPPPPNDAGAGGASPYAGEWQEVMGRLLIKHPKGEDDFCLGGTGVYVVYGHIHRMPGSGSGSTCLRYWLTGRLPDDPSLDCTEAFREYALHYVEATLKPFVELAPADWAWLPNAEAISTMMAAELLAMKEQGEQQRMNGQ